MENNKHLVRVGHEFAAAMSDDTPIITIAKMVTELASALDVQTARSEALAVENAALKNAISCHAAGFTVCEACGEENISGNDDVCRALNETPATDAFLAETRAQGVESAGEYLRQYAQSLHEEARLVLQDAAELCNGFAAQLRGNSNGGAL